MTKTIMILGMLLALAGLCAASPPGMEPPDVPRGEFVLEPFDYEPPTLSRSEALASTALPLDEHRVLLTMNKSDWDSTAWPRSAPFVIANLDDGGSVFLQNLHRSAVQLSPRGRFAVAKTFGMTPDGPVSRVWLIDTRTWVARELIENVYSEPALLLTAVLCPLSTNILLGYYGYDETNRDVTFLRLYNIESETLTDLAEVHSYKDAILWSPCGAQLFRSRQIHAEDPDAGPATTVVDRIDLEGSPLGAIAEPINLRFRLKAISPTAGHALIGISPDEPDERTRVAILNLSTGEIAELADPRPRHIILGWWSPDGDRLVTYAWEADTSGQASTPIYEFGTDGALLRRWDFTKSEVAEFFWMPGRDDPYAVTTRGEIYHLQGEGDNTFRRRVWSMHPGPREEP